MKAEPMTITEIIDELTRIREMYGEDTEVCFEDGDMDILNVSDINYMEGKSTKTALLCS